MTRRMVWFARVRLVPVMALALLMVVVLAGCVVVSDGAPVYGGYGYAAVPVVIAPGYGYSSAHRYGPHYRGGR